MSENGPFCYVNGPRTIIFWKDLTQNLVITLYTLNLHDILCQLYLNKAREKPRI